MICNNIVNEKNWSPYHDEFKTAKLVQINDFINDDMRKNIVDLIASNSSKVLYNSESMLDILGQLGSINLNKTDAQGAKIKQHYIISGTEITKHYPYLRHLYHSCFRDHVSKIVGTQVYPCEEMQTVNNTIIIYANENDSIRWHVDKSLFNGKRVFTLLIYLYNRSSQELCYIHNENNVKHCLHTPENSCVLLEHFILQHGVTPLKEGEKRIVWSMTFAELPATNSISGYIANKMKNYSYIGYEALNVVDIIVLIIILILIGIVIRIIVLSLLKSFSVFKPKPKKFIKSR